MSSVIIFFSSKSINLPGVATTMWQPLEEGGRREERDGGNGVEKDEDEEKEREKNLIHITSCMYILSMAK